MRLVVADDSALMREGLVGLLERQDHFVVGQAASATELVDVMNDLSVEELPDVVITDVRMPPNFADDGLEAAVAIRDRWPHVGILIVSQYVTPAYVSKLISHEFQAPTATGMPTGDHGGVGYLLKDRVSRVSDFLRSLSIVAAGGVVIDPEVATSLVGRRTSVLDSLTAREKEVLGLMAEGLSNPQISDRLVLSSGAVSKHVANVFSKLGLGPDEENRRVRAVLTYLSTHK